MNVLDASAALAFLMGEVGADVVEPLLAGSVIGAANLSEVVARFEGASERALVQGLLAGKGVVIEPVSLADGMTAAAMKFDGRAHLSLGARLCLALGERLGGTVVTADRAWGSSPQILQIRP